MIIQVAFLLRTLFIFAELSFSITVCKIDYLWKGEKGFSSNSRSLVSDVLLKTLVCNMIFVTNLHKLQNWEDKNILMKASYSASNFYRASLGYHTFDVRWRFSGLKNQLAKNSFHRETIFVSWVQSIMLILFLQGKLEHYF